MMWSGRGVLATIQFRDDSIMAGGEALKTVEFQPVAGGDAALRPQLSVVRSLQLDRSRDDLLTEFGKKTLEDRYLLPGESYQDMFARVATAYADDADHAPATDPEEG